MQRKTLTGLGAGTLMAISLLGGSAAMAQDQEDAGNAAELQAFQSAQVSLGEAISAAEKETGGKAMDAKFETGEGEGAMYEIEILKADGSQVYATVDPSDGSVQVSNSADDSDEPNGDMDEGDGDGETNDD